MLPVVGIYALRYVVRSGIPMPLSGSCAACSSHCKQMTDVADISAGEMHSHHCHNAHASKVHLTPGVVGAVGNSSILLAWIIYVIVIKASYSVPKPHL